MKNIAKFIIVISCSVLIFTSCSTENTNAQNQINENQPSTNEIVSYTNDELCNMALNFYQKETGEDTSNIIAAAETLDNGQVLIQLYTNLGDHNSTAAWYTVDRITAIGTNPLGEEIDLNKYNK